MQLKKILYILKLETKMNRLDVLRYISVNKSTYSRTL